MCSVIRAEVMRVPLYIFEFCMLFPLDEILFTLFVYHDMMASLLYVKYIYCMNFKVSDLSHVMPIRPNKRPNLPSLLTPKELASIAVWTPVQP